MATKQESIHNVATRLSLRRGYERNGPMWTKSTWFSSIEQPAYGTKAHYNDELLNELAKQELRVVLGRCRGSAKEIAPLVCNLFSNDNDSPRYWVGYDKTYGAALARAIDAMESSKETEEEKAIWEARHK